MCLIGRFSARLYVVYSVFYLLGTMLSMQVIVIKYRPVQTSEHMLALGTFLVIQMIAVIRYSISLFVQYRRDFSREESMWEDETRHLARIQERWAAVQRVMLQRSGTAVFAVCVLAWIYGAISDWWSAKTKVSHGEGALYINNTWPSKDVSVINRSSASQPTMWANYFYELHMLLPLTPVGLYFCFEQLTDAKVFIITYTVVAAYFSGFMVRMMLFLCPVVCICAGIGLSSVLKARMRDLTSGLARSPDYPMSAAAAMCSTRTRLPQPVAALTVAAVGWLLMLFVQHSVWCASENHRAPSLLPSERTASRAVAEDYREGHRWIAENLPRSSRLLVWPDCGFRLSSIMNNSDSGDDDDIHGTVLVESCCSEEIAPWPLLGQHGRCNKSLAMSMSSALFLTEEVAWAALRRLEVEWVLLLLGGHVSQLLDPAQQPLLRPGGANTSIPVEAPVRRGPDEPRASRDNGRGESVNTGEEAEGVGPPRVDSLPASHLPHSLVYKLVHQRCGLCQFD
jgi:dolichyl-diphosphooligosaccharide---protein glycosyltransferase